MGYCGCMGYEVIFPANQLGGLKNVWDLREYVLCEPWVTRESTVVLSTSEFSVDFGDHSVITSNKSSIFFDQPLTRPRYH